MRITKKITIGKQTFLKLHINNIRHSENFWYASLQFIETEFVDQDKTHVSKEKELSKEKVSCDSGLRTRSRWRSKEIMIRTIQSRLEIEYRLYGWNKRLLTVCNTFYKYQYKEIPKHMGNNSIKTLLYDVSLTLLFIQQKNKSRWERQSMSFIMP
jgi:hypothetical protein